MFIAADSTDSAESCQWTHPRFGQLSIPLDLIDSSTFIIHEQDYSLPHWKRMRFFSKRGSCPGSSWVCQPHRDRVDRSGTTRSSCAGIELQVSTFGTLTRSSSNLVSGWNDRIVSHVDVRGRRLRSKTIVVEHVQSTHIETTIHRDGARYRLQLQPDRRAREAFPDIH